MSNYLVKLQERADIVASFLTEEKGTIMLNLPNWLPRFLKKIYLKHEVGHINFIEKQGRAQTNPLDAIYHNLRAFQCELCSCNQPISQILEKKKELKIQTTKSITFCPKLFLCDSSPSILKVAFIGSALATIPFLSIKPKICTRKNENCLLSKIRL